MELNTNPFKSLSKTLDDLLMKVKYALYSSTNDDYIHNYDYYEKAYVQHPRLDFLRDKLTYDFFKNRNHYALYGTKDGDVR